LHGVLLKGSRAGGGWVAAAGCLEAMIFKKLNNNSKNRMNGEDSQAGKKCRHSTAVDGAECRDQEGITERS
jgi:hypothetical protein